MRLGKNPLLASEHKHKLNVIYQQIPALEENEIENVLSLYDFFSSQPQKFHSKIAFESYYKFMTLLADDNFAELKEILSTKKESLDIAFKSLATINNQNIHDVFPPSNEISRIRFIDKQIHYNYQRLVEGVYHSFIYPIAFRILKSKNKNTSKMDIYNCNEIVTNSDYKHLTEFYDHSIRNAIAHNDIEYYEREILYRNGKNESKVSSLKTIELFDNLLDVCNGISFALKTFFLANNDFFQDNNLEIPKWVIIEELMPNLNDYYWEVQDLFESRLPDDKRQLNIYTKNSLIQWESALFHGFQTAILAEKFLSGYDRYFISSESKYAWICFGGFNGKILKENREKGTENYLDVTEGGFFFNPNFKIPKFIIKLRRAYFSIRNEFKYVFIEKRTKPFKVRWTESHRNVYHSVVHGAVVIDDKSYLEEDFVRENVSKIVKKAIKESRKNTSKLKIHRYLPVGYLTIFVYSDDRRLREIKNAGLIENLVCTVQVRKLKRITSPDIMKSKIETIGKYRIAWNFKSPVYERVKDS